MFFVREKKRRRNNFDLTTAIHEAEYCNLERPGDPTHQDPIEPDHKFEVVLEADSFTNEKYALFANYQKTVQKEAPSSITASGFKRFLCSGIGQRVVSANGKPRKLGSYHHCYRLDGRLIAIGFLDLLPNGVSSVYLVYHEDFNHWNFGKISALQEISLALEGGYGYYYMGFYIHSCIKMRYKGAYKPTYILGVSLKPRVSKVDASDIKLTPCPKDPETYEWDPLDSETINRLNIRDYVSLSRERRLGITVSQSTSHVSNLSEDDQDYLHQGQQANDDKNDEMSSPVPRRGPLPQPQSNSLFAVNMPGVMTPSEVSSKIDLKRWKLRIDDSLTVSLGDLAIFYETDITDPDTIKGLAAEFAATLGSELVNGSQIILDWMR
ncbi:Arginyl-tRNA--protein transferase 1 [Bachmanniomyces sp. S44760]|nr:Arginyl-tRNA--protein transferase 1 [Bachmanniomyces sp. S44760]